MALEPAVLLQRKGRTLRGWLTCDLSDRNLYEHAGAPRCEWKFG